MKPAGDILERIYAAADSLFEQGGRSAFPTVDAVRKTARVNMNDANSGMREWRRGQMARAAPVAVQVPAAIAQAQSRLVAELWQAAQATAGDALAAAQAAWDVERTQLESLNREMADAFEAQGVECEAARGDLLRASERADGLAAEMANLQSALKELRVRTASAESDAQRDAMRANEVEHRALDLRRELDQAHQTLTAAHSEHRAAMQAHEAELRAVREDARQAETLMRAELAASRRQQRALMQIASGAKASTPFNSGRYSEKGDP